MQVLLPSQSDPLDDWQLWVQMLYVCAVLVLFVFILVTLFFFPSNFEVNSSTVQLDQKEKKIIKIRFYLLKVRVRIYNRGRLHDCSLFFSNRYVFSAAVILVFRIVHPRY